MKKFKILNQVKWTIFLTGISITVCLAGIYIVNPAYLKLMDQKLYDVFLNIISTKNKPESVVIVDIDEYSIEQYGHWPWPRYRTALLLKKIQAYGALAIGIDSLFSDPDSTSPNVLKKTIKRDFNLDIEFKGLPKELMDNDKLFADNLKTGPFILGYSFYFQPGDISQKGKEHLPALKISEIKKTGSKHAADYLISASQVILPITEFLKNSDFAGFMNAQSDSDGVLRRVPLMIAWQGKIYPHLSLATLLTALKGRINNPMVKVTRGGIESIQIGKTVVPLGSEGSILINYRGPSFSFPYIPAADVLGDNISKNALKNKIVFLGSSAPGLMDMRTSPLDNFFPGVEVNATIVDNILNRQFLSRPDWVPGLELIVVFVWGIITTILIGWSGSWLTLPVTGFLAVSAWFGGIWCLKTYHIWVSPFFPLLVLVSNFSILNFIKFWFSEKKKIFYRSAFSKYVSKTVVDQISRFPEKMNLEGEEKSITIMFADIRNFSRLSEKLSPIQLTSLLHDYFTPITQSIIKNDGTLDKFIGDAVMCFWNAPITVANHQGKAVKTGFEMLQSLEKLNQTFLIKYGFELHIGIGIHSGTCRVGNMGTSDLFDYTIIGDNVNLTSRLESLTKYYGVQMIISKTIKQSLPPLVMFKELDKVQVVGKTIPAEIGTIYLPKPEDKEDLEMELTAYASGLFQYKQQSFEKAHDIFIELCEQYPETRVNEIYRQRCHYFMKNPPGSDWDGVFVHKIK